ncbi:hypothetical protein KC19_2G089100 [Ceratodon purpureus]|uniref:Uncharacterized protein n=1 Tax=Ceratodon purpureus TaxID=3225 RepID=A0A8T0IUC7_CERPU|nr:hypothetical protein KC19_2G089100 [Ceratodon purpureus]
MDPLRLRVSAKWCASRPIDPEPGLRGCYSSWHDALCSLLHTSSSTQLPPPLPPPQPQLQTSSPKPNSQVHSFELSGDNHRKKSSARRLTSSGSTHSLLQQFQHRRRTFT